MIRNRYRRIVWFFARLLASLAIWDIFLPRLGLRGWSKRTRPERLRRAARAYRGLAVAMGGVLIKVGQFLSTRVDVLPKEFTDELSNLQDEVPPEAFCDIRRVAEEDLGAPLEQKFAWVDPQPLAAASLGQVHRARLYAQAATAGPATALRTELEQEAHPGREVVVKVQRPNIELIITTDLAALQTVGRWLQRYRPIGRRANVPSLLDEFTKTLYEEIDYLAEGHNAETFAANFAHNTAVRVPEVIWSHTTTRVLTLENVLAIKITDYEAIQAAGIDRREVASRLLDTYLQQIFEDGFFHADPHPGNLFVLPTQNGTWRLTFVDFGMVGHVPPNTKNGLRELLVGVGTRDAARVVKAYQMLDVLLPGADLELIQRAESRAFEQFWGKNMTEMTRLDTAQIQQFTDEFRDLIYELPFQVPQDFIFLARCVGILSGMCTGLDRQFNVWEHLAPYAQKLIAEEARANREQWLDEARRVVQALLTVPRKMDSMLAKMERGEIAVRAPEVSQQVRRLETGMKQITTAILFTALLLGGIQLTLAGVTWPGTALLGLAGICMLALLWRGMRG